MVVNPVCVFFHNGNAVVIGTHPETCLAVHKQADNIGDARGRIHTFKALAVVACKSAVAAYPNKSVRRLCNGIGLGSRQSVGIVIKHSRIAVTFSGRIHSNRSTVGRSHHRIGGCGSCERRSRKTEEKRQTNAHT